MNASSWSRRRFLYGAGAAGAASLALPLLPSIGHTQDLGLPKRLLVFFSGNGTIYDNWKPSSEGGVVSELSPILAPLEAHLDDLIVIDGVENTAGNGEHQPRTGFHGHERGIGSVLTGTHLNEGSMEANSWYANGISVDQFIANAIEQPGTLHSLQVGIISKRHSKGWYNRDTMTYAGANDPLFAESDGSKLFTQVFGDGAASPEIFEQLRARRQSVLDYLKDDLVTVESKLSAADKQRLAQHHETFRSLETRLSQPPPDCDEPADPGISNWLEEDNITQIADFQMEQTVQALACNRTQVATIQFGKGLGSLSLRPAGYTDSWHGVSHEGDDNQEAQRKLTEMNTYVAERFSKLLDFMKAIPEGDGTLLDHSVVLWVNELGKGNDHTYDRAPVVLAGGLHNTFNTGGRHVLYENRPNNDLLITLCQAFDQEVTEFGKPGLSTGPLTELLV